MIGWSLVNGTANITKGKRFLSTKSTMFTKNKAFPWGNLPQNTTICDIGGGNGHVTRELFKAQPGLKAVIQDLGPVLQGDKAVRSLLCSSLRDVTHYAFSLSTGRA